MILSLKCFKNLNLLIYRFQNKQGQKPSTATKTEQLKNAHRNRKNKDERNKCFRDQPSGREG